MSNDPVSADELRLHGEIVGAALADPPRFLPVLAPYLNGGAILVPGFREVYRELRVSDPRCATATIAQRLGPERLAAMLAPLANRLPKVDIAFLLDLESTGEFAHEAYLEERAKVAVARHRQRAVASLLRAGARQVESADAAEIDAKLDELRRSLDSPALAPAEADRLRLSARSFRSMREDPVPQPLPLLGDGLLRPGQFGLLHGPDGTRKSWSGLHLCVAAVCGIPWFDVPTRPDGVRAGLLSLEDDEPIIRDRLERVVFTMGADRSRVDDRLSIVCPPRFPDPYLDLTSAPAQAMLRAWLADQRAELLVVDHLSRCHAMPDERDFRPVTRPLITLCRELSLGSIVQHHDRKSDAHTAPGTDRGAARGDSRLSADARLRIGMAESRGRILLRFEKSTGAERPADRWLDHDPDTGALILAEEPARPGEEADKRREILLAAIRDTNREGLDLAGACAAIPDRKERTVRAYLSDLAARGLVSTRGSTTDRRWFDSGKVVSMPEALPQSLQGMD